MKVPDDLGWWRDVPGGSAWLERLPALAASCAYEWRLRLGTPLAGGSVALVVGATRTDGTEAVLKLSFPDEESEHEGAALAQWDGAGAVRVLRRDDARRALLLERIAPGSPLWDVADDEEATITAASLLVRLHAVPLAPVHPFRPLGELARHWAETIPADWLDCGRPYDRRLRDTAVDACRALTADAPPDRLLHQDFHGGNVLRSVRDGWVVIDPKPLVGDPAFDAASLLRDRRWLLGRTDDASRIRRRLDVLAETTGLDRERMRLWGIVHALAWGVSGRAVDADVIRCAELLLSS